MASIRRTVEHVCAVLSSFGIDYITAETLRKAKYDKPEPIPLLLQLIHDVILLHKSDALMLSSEDCRAFLDMARVRLSKQKSDFLVSFVKYELRVLGMNYSNERSSRSLLLSFGLVCHKTNLFDKWTQKQLQSSPSQDPVNLPPYREDTLNSLRHKSTMDAKGRHATASVAQGLSGVQGLSKESQILAVTNIIHSIIGRLDAVVREIRSRQRERNTLQHKIRTLTKGAERPEQGVILTRDHMSMFEVHLLRHKKQYMAHLQHLESVNERGADISEAQKHHMVFFAWLQSALDEELPPDDDMMDEAIDRLNFVKQDVTSKYLQLMEQSNSIAPLWSKVCRQRRVMALVDDLVNEEEEILSTVRGTCTRETDNTPKSLKKLHVVCQCPDSKRKPSQRTEATENSSHPVQWTLLPPPGRGSGGPPISSSLQCVALKEALEEMEHDLHAQEQHCELLRQRLREQKQDIAVVDTPP